MMSNKKLPEAQEAALRALECFEKVSSKGDAHNHYRDAMEGHLLLAKIYMKQGMFCTTRTRDCSNSTDTPARCGIDE